MSAATEAMNWRVLDGRFLIGPDEHAPLAVVELIDAPEPSWTARWADADGTIARSGIRFRNPLKAMLHVDAIFSPREEGE